MALANDLQNLRDTALEQLRKAHDYHAEAKLAWRIVERAIAVGLSFTHQNTVTGTMTTATDLVRKSRGYVSEQLAEATFQQFLAIFEHFFFNLLRLWLQAHPRSLMKRQVEFETILDAPDKEALVTLVVAREVNEVLYKKPADWFVYLESKVKLGCPTPDEIDRLTEAKAARDVLAHNQGIANKLYLAKAGSRARCAEGDRIEVPEPYHREIWELLCKMVSDLANAALTKAT